MAINFLSLIGFKPKSRKMHPEAAPEPQPPVPEVTAELSVKEDFHDAIAHTDKGWFRFDSSRSELLASMTVSYDIREITREFKTDWRAYCHMVETPVRIIHTSSMIRLFRSSAEDNVLRLFIVSDMGGSFIDGAPATKRQFYPIDAEEAGGWADAFLNKKPPYGFICRQSYSSEVSNEKITDVTIPDEAALKSLIPNY